MLSASRRVTPEVPRPILNTDRLSSVYFSHSADICDANFLNTPEKSPAVAINQYGKGQALYLATAAQPPIIGSLVRGLYTRLGIERGPETPTGVYARVVEGRTLYVNTTKERKSARLKVAKLGVLSGRHYSGSLLLGALRAGTPTISGSFSQAYSEIKLWNKLKLNKIQNR